MRNLLTADCAQACQVWTSRSMVRKLTASQGCALTQGWRAKSPRYMEKFTSMLAPSKSCHLTTTRKKQYLI